jgi:hypothetical protein
MIHIPTAALPASGSKGIISDPVVTPSNTIKQMSLQLCQYYFYTKGFAAAGRGISLLERLVHLWKTP